MSLRQEVTPVQQASLFLSLQTLQPWHPGTHAGAAHPVRGDGVTMDPVMKEKLENYASSLLSSYVGKRGRNVEVAESAMKESKAFTAEEPWKRT